MQWWASVWKERGNFFATSLLGLAEYFGRIPNIAGDLPSFSFHTEKYNIDA
jgi:hypothetical protein